MHVTEKTCIEKDCVMSSRSKREYLEAIYLRYRRGSRKDKAIILDEFCTKKRWDVANLSNLK
jgi:hypothetical protein